MTASASLHVGTAVRDTAEAIQEVHNARSRKSDETRRTILDAALRVIARKGYTAATVDEIVREAGVSKGLAYYHFKNKAEMADSILEEGVNSLVDDFQRIVDKGEGPGETLLAILDVFASTIFDRHDFGAFFVSELWRNGREWTGSLGMNVQRLIAMISDQYRAGQTAGVIREDIDVEFHSVALVGMVLTSALYYLDDNLATPSISKDEFVDRICDYARHATAVRGQLG